jgi:hypothetical protein
VESLQRPKLFFIRVMKTGSMTLTELLRAHYPRDATYPGPEVTNLDLALESAAPAYLAELPKETRHSLRLVAHHLPFAARTLLDGDFLTCAFFRHPVDRVISHLRSELDTSAGEGAATLEEAYECPRLPSLERDNMMLKHFAMTPEDMRSVLGHYPIDGRAYDRAVANVRCLDFIGLFDEVESDIRRLGAQFGFEFREVPHMNRSRVLDVPQSLRERIAANNAEDMAFYEEVRGIYETRRSAAR